MMGASPETSPTPHLDRMAVLLQELMTAVVRIRAGREQVSNLDDFRAHVLEALGAARDQARRKGYSEEQTRYAVYAVVAFLDEAVLSSANPKLAGWRGRPLGAELFKGHVAGEKFFQYVRDLLEGDNSQRTADLLEVYQLCLLLGYRGRYGAESEGNLRAIQDRIGGKIVRIRGAAPPLAPAALPSQDAIPMAHDRWSAVMLWGAAGVAVLALILLFVYRGALNSGLGALGLWLEGFPG
jgi:type VI secretion system protein ImpK